MDARNDECENCNAGAVMSCFIAFVNGSFLHVHWGRSIFSISCPNSCLLLLLQLFNMPALRSSSKAESAAPRLRRQLLPHRQQFSFFLLISEQPGQWDIVFQRRGVGRVISVNSKEDYVKKMLSISQHKKKENDRISKHNNIRMATNDPWAKKIRPDSILQQTYDTIGEFL